MADITVEEFNRLKPKEIREYYGTVPLARIIKYIQEGQSNHRVEAIRTLNYWLKGLRVRKHTEDIKMLSMAIPYIIEKFPQEHKIARLAMAVTIHSFVRSDALLGEDFVKKIKELIQNEEDEEVKKKLNQALSWDETNKWFKTKQDNLILSLNGEEDLSYIEDSEFYQVPLHFLPKSKKPVMADDIQCVYFLQEKDNGFIKIGKTGDLKTKVFFPYKMPFEWEVIHIIEDENYAALEKYFHNRYKIKNINGEWFRLNAEDIEDIKNFQKERHKKTHSF